jgi:hypothetical protein
VTVRVVLIAIGYVIAWLVLLPLFVIVGGLALFTYALVAELGALLGVSKETLDSQAARESARRMSGVRRLSNAARAHAPRSTSS